MASSSTLLSTIAAQPSLDSDIPGSPTKVPFPSVSAIPTIKSRTELPRFLTVTERSITSPGESEALPPPSSIDAPWWKPYLREKLYQSLEPSDPLVSCMLNWWSEPASG